MSKDSNLDDAPEADAHSPEDLVVGPLEPERTSATYRQRPTGRVRIDLASVFVLAAVSLTALGCQPGAKSAGGGAPASGQPSAPASASLSAPASASPSATSSAPVSAIFDPSGILLIGPGEQVQARPGNEQIATAFNDALQLAMNHPDDLGYPWLDPLSGELVLSVATEAGRALLETAIAVPHRIRDVAHSYGELQRIQDGVTFLASEGVTDAQLIYKTYPDQRDNRAAITISRMSRPLLEELVRRYPADAIAVQVDPNQPQVGP